MKKIMFSEHFGLQQAVIAKRKTMTRRIINDDYEDVKAYHANGGWHFIADTKDGDSVEVKPAYEVGETIAIAQAYQTLRWPALPGIDWKAITDEVTHSKGWTNKMFVKAELMPHQIQITDIQVQRLRDISIEDCFKEGIQEFASCSECGGPIYTLPEPNDDKCYFHPREAFEVLINGVCPRLTWESNPWVFVYSFKLIR